MKTSDMGLTFLSHWEGEVLHVYKDQVGVPTIGVGHALKAGESFPNGITHDQAMTLLSHDAAIAESAINGHTTVTLTQNQFDALVSFTFNLGTGAFTSSTLLKLLNAGNVQGAADEFPKWCHAGGALNQGILNRRNSERALFLKPDAVVPAPVIDYVAPVTWGDPSATPAS
jgi:lysozyme